MVYINKFPFKNNYIKLHKKLVWAVSVLKVTGEKKENISINIKVRLIFKTRADTGYGGDTRIEWLTGAWYLYLSLFS